ncbi:hypothetical protein B5M09_012360 [Aphanomyces astaci]|uniref:Integrase catalytic domain-containing protein n=1 Tax=Aphanomyces astaci TaxID=112090 RepID=A0A3R7XPQ6_APHAT|nr:hypothetical protein B5M09_012360 [Aphanomyces astaci]
MSIPGSPTAAPTSRTNSTTRSARLPAPTTKIKPAYSSCTNGTVEEVNRLILRAVKTLASELKLHLVLGLVQGALNNMPCDPLSGIAPVTAFTGLSATTPLSAFINTVTKEVANIDWLDSTRKKHVDELH